MIASTYYWQYQWDIRSISPVDGVSKWCSITICLRWCFGRRTILYCRDIWKDHICIRNWYSTFIRQTWKFMTLAPPGPVWRHRRLKLKEETLDAVLVFFVLSSTVLQFWPSWSFKEDWRAEFSSTLRRLLQTHRSSVFYYQKTKDRAHQNIYTTFYLGAEHTVSCADGNWSVIHGKLVCDIFCWAGCQQISAAGYQPEGDD